MTQKIILGITGASGAIYGRRILQALCKAGADVWLCISDNARPIIRAELGIALAEKPDLKKFANVKARYLAPSDLHAPPASGSFPADGMVIAPCSMSTLGAIASGHGTNLIHRAADVTLKERRPLVLVARETPLSAIHLENMLRLAHAGATVLPACPAFYHGARTIDDLVDFVVSRALDALGIKNSLIRRWGE
jgi:4-hydroxy-3-polyprenylbenzoate decarboxylase